MHILRIRRPFVVDGGVSFLGGFRTTKGGLQQENRFLNGVVAAYLLGCKGIGEALIQFQQFLPAQSTSGKNQKGTAYRKIFKIHDVFRIRPKAFIDQIWGNKIQSLADIGALLIWIFPQVLFGGGKQITEGYHIVNHEN